MEPEEADFHPQHEGDFFRIIDQFETECSTVTIGFAKIAGAETKFTNERPHQLIDETPILLVPGFHGIKPGYKKLRGAIVETGRDATTYEPRLMQDLLTSMDPRRLIYPEKLTSKCAYAVMRALHQMYGHEKFDLAGHSMGGPIASDIALHKPEMVRSLILLGSAGLEDHNLISMAQRVSRFITKELIPAAPQLRNDFDHRIVGYVIRHSLGNPLLTAREMFDVCGRDIRSNIVKHGTDGIATFVFQFEDDSLFITERVWEQSGHLPDHFEIIQGSNHLAPQLQPDRIGHLIVQKHADNYGSN